MSHAGKKINTFIARKMIKSFIPCFLFLLLSCAKDSIGDNQEPLPILIVDNVKQTESNLSFEFIIKLNKASTDTVLLKYSTVNGSAKSGEDFYAEVDHPFSFQPGEIYKKIVVQIMADDIREDDEDFTIQITDVLNAIVAKSSGHAVIYNDDL